MSRKEINERSPTPFTPVGGRHPGLRYVDDKFDDRGNFVRERGESPIGLSDRSESPAPVMPMDEAPRTPPHTPDAVATENEDIPPDLPSVNEEGSVARRIYFTGDDGVEYWYVPFMNDDGTEEPFDPFRSPVPSPPRQGSVPFPLPSPSPSSSPLPSPPRPGDVQPLSPPRSPEREPVSSSRASATSATVVFDNAIPPDNKIRTTKRCRHFITTDCSDIIRLFNFLHRVRILVMGRIIRYITYCHEQPHRLFTEFGQASDAWGIEHWHVLVDFFEPVDATTAEEMLFGEHDGFAEEVVDDTGRLVFVNRHIFTQPVRDFHACRFYLCKKDTKVPGTRAGEIGLIKERGLSRWRSVNSSHIVPARLIAANIGKPVTEQQLYERTAEHWKRMRNEEGWPRLTRPISLPPVDPIRQDYDYRLDDPPISDAETTLTINRTYIHEE